MMDVIQYIKKRQNILPDFVSGNVYNSSQAKLLCLQQILNSLPSEVREQFPAEVKIILSDKIEIDWARFFEAFPSTQNSGQDDHPAWRYVARVLSPSAGKMTNEELLATRCLVASHDDIDPYVAILLSRMAMCIMGKEWCDNWLYQNNGVRYRDKRWFKDMYKKIGKKIYTGLYGQI